MGSYSIVKDSIVLYLEKNERKMKTTKFSEQNMGRVYFSFVWIIFQYVSLMLVWVSYNCKNQQ